MKRSLKRKKELRSCIMSITFTLLFLVLATLYIYYPNKQEILSSFSFLKNNQGVYIEEISDGINLAHAYPISDQEGINTKGYRFIIKNTSGSSKKFKLSFINQFDKIKDRGLVALDTKYLRYNIEDDSKEIFKTSQLEDDFLIYEGSIDGNSEYTFEFKVWLGDNFDEDALGKTFIGQMQVDTI